MKRIKSELKETRNFRNMPDVFVPYPLNFALKHDLSATQTLVYSIIRQYSKLEHKAYTGSIQTLQVMINGSKSAILNALKVLSDKGFITKFINENGRPCYKDNYNEYKKEKYIPFPLRFSIAYDLSSTQTLLYAIIAHCSRLKKKAFTGSLTTLGNYLNCAKNTVITALEQLIIRGFIIKYKDESANVTYVDGLSHKPGYTEKELAFNALWVKENGLTREKQGRSTRKKGSEATWFNLKKNDSHFENERKYTDKELAKLTNNWEDYSNEI